MWVVKSKACEVGDLQLILNLILKCLCCSLCRNVENVGWYTGLALSVSVLRPCGQSASLLEMTIFIQNII